MNMTRKFASLLLAMILVLCAVTPAMAAGTHSITVKNAVEKQDYKLYKMLDLEVNDAVTAYSYTVNANWNAFFTGEGAGAKYVEIDDQGYVTWKTDADVVAFAKDAETFAKDKNALKTETTTTDGDITFDGLEAGYYLVTSTLGTKATVGTTPGNPNPEIKEKNQAPENVKNVQEDSDGKWGTKNDADIGQTVNFKSTITARVGAENYVFHDTMSKGLTYNKDAKVYTDEGMTVELAQEHYTVNHEGNDKDTFTITFTQTYLDTITAETKLYVKYSATLNANAVIGQEGNPNSSKLTYGDKSNTTSGANTTPDSTTTTYTWSMKVFKYTENGETEQPLAGAKFTLSKNSDGTDPIKLINTAENTYRVAKEGEDGAITEIETDATGKFTINGLDSDTYYLTETKAPDGYNKLASPITVVINADGKVNVTENQPNGVDEIKVLNQSGTELPSTGGMGTTLFYVVGGVLVVAAFVLLVTKRRVGAEK